MVGPWCNHLLTFIIFPALDVSYESDAHLIRSWCLWILPPIVGMLLILTSPVTIAIIPSKFLVISYSSSLRNHDVLVMFDYTRIIIGTKNWYQSLIFTFTYFITAFLTWHQSTSKYYCSICNLPWENAEILKRFEIQ